MRYFETVFLEEVKKFLKTLHPKTARKVLYNIDLAEQTNDPRLFKKLKSEIWEFRTKYAGLQVRLLAFWDKTDNKETLVIAAHGFIKKRDKVPTRSEEHTSELQSRGHLVCRLLLEKKKEK